MVEKRWPAGIRPQGKGLRIRIWKEGKLHYSETLDGDPYKKRDLAAAIKRRDELKSRVKLNLPLWDNEETENHLFAVVAQEYLETLDVEYSTSLSYEGIINQYWMPEFRNHIVEEIRTKQIKRVLANCPVSQKTKRNALVPLRGIFDFVDINPNPAQFKLKKHQKATIERYTPVERNNILSKLEGQALVYFVLLFATGMRPGEVLALRWDDYMDMKRFHVHSTIVRRRYKNSTKTHDARFVYVPSWARVYLNNHPTRFKGGFIFLHSLGEHFTDSDSFNREWKRAHDDWNKENRRNQIKYRVPYTCRHTRAAELLSTGVEPADAAKQLGHTVEMFFRTYSEWIDEYTRNKDDARFEGATDNLPTKLGV